VRRKRPPIRGLAAVGSRLASLCHAIDPVTMFRLDETHRCRAELQSCRHASMGRLELAVVAAVLVRPSRRDHQAVVHEEAEHGVELHQARPAFFRQERDGAAVRRQPEQKLSNDARVHATREACESASRREADNVRVFANALIG
jgi:hypothetical protein